MSFRIDYKTNSSNNPRLSKYDRNILGKCLKSEIHQGQGHNVSSSDAPIVERRGDTFTWGVIINGGYFDFFDTFFTFFLTDEFRGDLDLLVAILGM